ncbi:hypothetical protein Tco_0905814 [Tanacetum coccineum]
MESHSLSVIKMARTCLVISHIFFADDSLFFLKASQAECQTLIRILNLYFQASGQSVNFQKPSAFFSPNTPTLLCNDICDALHVQLMDPKAKYLGVPSVYEPKEKGGLGFRDLEAFNTALLAKQGWRLLMNPGAFWVKVLKGIYFPNCGFLIAKMGSHPSWIWSSLLHGRDLLLQGVRWQVGDGRNISFWTQKWIPYSEDFYIRYPLGPFKIGELVSGFILNPDIKS